MSEINKATKNSIDVLLGNVFQRKVKIYYIIVFY